MIEFNWTYLKKYQSLYLYIYDRAESSPLQSLLHETQTKLQQRFIPLFNALFLFFNFNTNIHSHIIRHKLSIYLFLILLLFLFYNLKIFSIKLLNFKQKKIKNSLIYTHMSILIAWFVLNQGKKSKCKIPFVNI